jgi:hypothetical protein
MGRNLPARTVFNGEKPAKSGRDLKGRFVPGAPPGPGRPANPFGRYQAELRGALLSAVSPADLRAITRTVIRLAKRGHVPSVELLLRWTLGAPPAPIDPDRLDEHELSVRRGRPTMVDWLALADEQADREPAEMDPHAEDPDEAPAIEGEATPLDAGDPPLRVMLSWALRELAEAERRVAPPPPDPAAGWETCAAGALEWDASAAVPVDLLYLAYARWCGARGESVWGETQVLAWLTARGATVRTGPLSGLTSIAGVRVMA